jgi:2-polyprenyl-3-methyl-5-hydroxy-6-metoxy-1,4-benzoquinol methylase
MVDGVPTPATADEKYAERLNRLQNKRWKKILNVQLPWKLHMRRLKLGRVLDVGCGNGRNLQYVAEGSVGVDHNGALIQSAREAGTVAYTVDEFFADPELAKAESFDSILLAHVIEHLQPDEAREVIGSYLPFLKRGGRLVWITPQERGYKSDYTHVVFADFSELAALASDLGLEVAATYSFPFPRFLGKLFIYNEFVQVSLKP